MMCENLKDLGSLIAYIKGYDFGDKVLNSQSKSDFDILSSLIYNWLNRSTGAVKRLNFDYLKVHLNYLKKFEINHFDKNWLVKNDTLYHSSDKIHIWKSGEFALIRKGHFVYEYSPDDLMGTRNFTYISIHRPLLYYYNGFYRLRSLVYFDNSSPMCRLYLNLNLDEIEKVCTFLDDLTQYLNTFSFGWEIKFADYNIERSDNTILYFSQTHYYVIVQLITHLHERHHFVFNSACQPFTYRFGLNGVSFGEEPAYKSFGTVRSEAIAHAILETEPLNRMKQLDISKVVIELEKLGYNLRENLFYRNANSNYPYYFKSKPFVTSARKRKMKEVEFHDKLILKLAFYIISEAKVLNANKHMKVLWECMSHDEDMCVYQLNMVDDSLLNGQSGILLFLAVAYHLKREYTFIKHFVQDVLDSKSNEFPLKAEIQAIVNDKSESEEIMNWISPILFKEEMGVLKDTYNYLLKTFENDFKNNYIFNDDHNPGLSHGFSGVGLFVAYQKLNANKGKRSFTRSFFKRNTIEETHDMTESLLYSGNANAQVMAKFEDWIR